MCSNVFQFKSRGFPLTRQANRNPDLAFYMIYLPQNIPSIATLRAEGEQVGTFGLKQRINTADRRILLLNLMPQKAATELDMARVLAHAQVNIQLIPMRIDGQTYKCTPMSYMEAYYETFSSLESEYFDGLIITGAPVEQYPFEDVRYWSQLCHIMDWADTHVVSTLYVCWGAQAGLYHHYGVEKHQLPEKRFGIFKQDIIVPSCPLAEGLMPSFPMPHSRHTEVRQDEVERALGGLGHVIAIGRESGVGLVVTDDLHQVFVVGHLEYEPFTLHNEYHRDLAKHLPIHAPEHYYLPSGEVDYSWRDAAYRFYSNWVVKACAAR